MKIERVPAVQTVQTVSVCSSPADAGRIRRGLERSAAIERLERFEREPISHESFSSFHSSPGRYLFADGGDFTRRHRGLSAIACLGTAGSRLPHDPGGDFLSRSEPRCYGFRRYRAARETVRSNAGPKPNDVDQLGRKLAHHITVLA